MCLFASPATTEDASLLPGLWDFTEAYLANATAANYPPAARALALKNGVPYRIPPPQQRHQLSMVLLTSAVSAPTHTRLRLATPAISGAKTGIQHTRPTVWKPFAWVA